MRTYIVLAHAPTSEERRLVFSELLEKVGHPLWQVHAARVHFKRAELQTLCSHIPDTDVDKVLDTCARREQEIFQIKATHGTLPVSDRLYDEYCKHVKKVTREAEDKRKWIILHVPQKGQEMLHLEKLLKKVSAEFTFLV